MRLRTLLAIVAVLFALPAFSRAKTQPAPTPPAATIPQTPGKQASADALVAISDVRLDAATDEKIGSTNKNALLELAREGYLKALKQEPKHKGALLGLARVHARVDEKQKAVEAYKTYLTLCPTDADAAHELAVAHARWKDWAGACSWCEFALKVAPENRNVKKTHGFCLACAGKRDEAFAVLCQIMPEAQARHNLAGVLNHMGHTDASKTQLQLAVKADPNFAPARDLLNKLEGGAPAPAPRALPEMVTRVFGVMDLVTPAIGSEATATYRKNTEELIKLVTGMVRPYSWKEAGGRGTAEYFDIGTSLVVQNTPDVLQEVSDLLEALHRLAPTSVSVCFEVRVLKVPVGFCEKAGVKVARDTTLTPAQFQALLKAAQENRDANVLQFPKVTAIDGQTAHSKTGEEQSFVTGLEIMKVKGQNVYVPKNVAIFLGDVLALQGRVSAEGNYVHVQADLAHTHLAGPVELAPITTQITPIFEGGSMGNPVPLTQFLQVPDVRKERIEKAAVVPTGATLVIGGWKEVEVPKDKNAKPGKEFEMVALATVSVIKDVKSALDSALKSGVPPQPVAAPAVNNKNAVYKLRNVSAVDAVRAIEAYLSDKKLSATVVAEPVSNSVLVSAHPEPFRWVMDTLAAIDKAPKQVAVRAMVVQVPRGFVAQSGLTVGTPEGTNWTLSPRESRMLTELLRAAKERGECNVLTRPQICVCDNQTGYVQVGQQTPAAAGAVVPVGAKAEAQIGTTQNAITLCVTPRIAPDDKSVLLRTNLQIAEVNNVTPANAPASIHRRTLETTASVTFGSTFVAVCGSHQTDHSLTGTIRWLWGNRYETLVILTPEPVASGPEVRSAGWFTK